MSPVHNFHPMSKIVQVKVSQHRRTYFVHQDLLMQASEFLHMEITNSKEISTEGMKQIKVESRDDAFEIFVTWLYSGNIVNSRPGDGYKKKFEALLQAWHLGSELDVVHFQDAVIDKITTKLFGRHDIEADDTIAMFESLFDTISQPMELVADWLVHGNALSDPALLDDTIDELECAGLLRVFTGKLVEVRFSGNNPAPPYVKDPCNYHLHIHSDIPCYKTKSAQKEAMEEDE